MAGHLSHFILRLCAALLLPSMLGTSCWAQSLPDPMRPPNSLVPNSSGSPIEARPGEGTELQLQMVIRTPKGVLKALLGGEWVEQGGVLGVYRVVQIRPDSVILKSAAGSDEIRLTPAVTMRTPGIVSPSTSLAKVNKANQRVESSTADVQGSAVAPNGNTK